MRYVKPKADEWVSPVRRGYRLACCDCGLVHDMDFRIVAGRVEFRVRRNNRSTAAIRVGMGLRKNADGTYRASAGRRR